MIFMYPKVMKAKRSQGGNLSWCQATTEAFCPAINRWRERRAAKSDEQEISQEDDEKEEIPASHQQQGDTELVPSSLSRDVRPGSEEEKNRDRGLTARRHLNQTSCVNYKLICVPHL